MKLRFKRSLALLLCLALLGTLLPALPAQAEEIGIIPIEDPAEAGPVDGDEIVVIGEEPAEPLAGEPTIAEQPQSITKTSAQVILRWHLQAGNIAIPGSSNEAHIAENFDIFDFALSDEEMAELTDIDRDERFADY